MKRDMLQWITETIQTRQKKAMPVLSFPAIQKMGITVKELIEDSDLQAKAMKIIADSTDCAASLSFMDLSVEAESFGADIHVSDSEVPTVIGHIIDTMEEAEALQIPAIGSGRTGLYIDAVKKAVPMITDRPVLAGVIGPFSLAGRLLDVTESMIYCYSEPEMVHEVLKKATAFITDYCLAFKEAGANGVVMAEPLAGVLSPALAEEFSASYVKQIVDKVQDENFIVVYHNCGNGTPKQVDSIVGTGCKALHFGNAIDMGKMMELFPSDIIVAGNVDPAREFKNGTPESVAAATRKVLDACSEYPNFVISSGCDIPALSSWDNIDAFFKTVDAFYANEALTGNESEAV